MKIDKYGQIILNERDLVNHYLTNPDTKIINCLVEKQINFNSDLELDSVPELIEYVEQFISIQEFDQQCQTIWNMPEEYANFDIVQWLLDKCNNDAERQRVGEELLLYVDKDLLPLLQYLKYIVDIMRKYNIVWGVGRGSSVSSYVLYLLGVHKINSMFYDLDVHDFLR